MKTLHKYQGVVDNPGSRFSARQMYESRFGSGHHWMFKIRHPELRGLFRGRDYQSAINSSPHSYHIIPVIETP